MVVVLKHTSFWWLVHITRKWMIYSRVAQCHGVSPWQQGSWGQNGAHLGPTGPRWAPCWPHKLCPLGCSYTTRMAQVCVLAAKFSLVGDERLCHNLYSFLLATAEQMFIHREHDPSTFQHTSPKVRVHTAIEKSLRGNHWILWKVYKFCWNTKQIMEKSLKIWSAIREKIIEIWSDAEWPNEKYISFHTFLIDLLFGKPIIIKCN